ncbi:hypothetical protein GPJ56_006263 [Histomonas meleagridis]|uniref:uncharacterized protein n=1 Tax=Histomonas meleagridis TaxID=135588 RepID=UPI0035597730|nr:hypothetical protein GPJ56_006263 [Histomonas meleagridis]KAH0796921.1 hypothetical protein GO595_010814 [Histomonas meleagridis]
MNPAGFRNQEIWISSPYWNKLDQADKLEFQSLRRRFHQNQKISSKDPRLISFSNDLCEILRFIEHPGPGRENRTILAGVAFSGPFICVNTRQLKNFLGRCKSSINGSFQQLGYVALKTKSKARTCVLSLIPSLMNDQNTLRQWTVRCASSNAKFCFVSSIPTVQFPSITNDDLNEDHKPSATQKVLPQRPQFMPARTLSQNSFDLAIPNNINDNNTEEPVFGEAVHYGEMSSFYSLDCLNLVDADGSDNEWNPMWEQKSLPRSQSVSFGIKEDTRTFDFDVFDSL